MNFEIIFYRSGKTAVLQQELEKILIPFGGKLTAACAVSDNKELAEKMSLALKKRKLIIVTGRTDSSSESTEKLLSKILRPKDKKTAFAINTASTDGITLHYMVSGGQMILILPDLPESIATLEPRIRELITKYFNINAQIRKIDDISKVNEKIGQDRSITMRTPVIPRGSTAEKRNKNKLGTLKIIFIILISLGITELAAAVIIYFIQ